MSFVDPFIASSFPLFSSLMSVFLRSFSCLKFVREDDALWDGGLHDCKESEVVDLGEEGFSGLFSFSILLSTSIGSEESVSGIGLETESFVVSDVDSSAKFFDVCPA